MTADADAHRTRAAEQWQQSFLHQRLTHPRNPQISIINYNSSATVRSSDE
jgi:hypothetical protein